MTAPQKNIFVIHRNYIDKVKTKCLHTYGIQNQNISID